MDRSGTVGCRDRLGLLGTTGFKLMFFSDCLGAGFIGVALRPVAGNSTFPANFTWSILQPASFEWGLPVGGRNEVRK